MRRWQFGKGAGLFWWSGVGLGVAAGALVGRVAGADEYPTAAALLIGLTAFSIFLIAAGEMERPEKPRQDREGEK